MYHHNVSYTGAVRLITHKHVGRRTKRDEFLWKSWGVFVEGTSRDPRYNELGTVISLSVQGLGNSGLFGGGGGPSTNASSGKESPEAERHPSFLERPRDAVREAPLQRRASNKKHDLLQFPSSSDGGKYAFLQSPVPSSSDEGNALPRKPSSAPEAERHPSFLERPLDARGPLDAHGPLGRASNGPSSLRPLGAVKMVRWMHGSEDGAVPEETSAFLQSPVPSSSDENLQTPLQRRASNKKHDLLRARLVLDASTSRNGAPSISAGPPVGEDSFLQTGARTTWLGELPRWTCVFLLVSYVVLFFVTALGGGLSELSFGAPTSEKAGAGLLNGLMFSTAPNPLGGDTTNTAHDTRPPSGAPISARTPRGPSLLFDTGFESYYSYWTVRTVVIRVQAICYFAGFVDSLFQNRAIFGEDGLQPLWGPQQPHPPRAGNAWFFYVFGFRDIVLDVASLLGIWVSLLLFVADQGHAMVWAGLSWIMYMSILDLKAPMVHSYGWEWETCELGFVVSAGGGLI